ncbi:MAG: hypothetical protein RR946_05010 [Clostridia bacterium]
MSEQRDKEFVQSAVDACFSDLKGDPWLAQRIMNGVDKERKVKKKLSFGLVLALGLVLATVAVAIAAQQLGWVDFFGTNYNITVPTAAQEAMDATQPQTFQVGPMTFTFKQLLTDKRIAMSSAEVHMTDGTEVLYADDSNFYETMDGISDTVLKKYNLKPGTTWVDAAKQLELPLYGIRALIEIAPEYGEGQAMESTLWNEDGSIVYFHMPMLNKNAVTDDLPIALYMAVHRYDPATDEVKVNQWTERKEITLPVAPLLAEKTYLPQGDTEFAEGMKLVEVHAEQYVTGIYLTCTFTVPDGMTKEEASDILHRSYLCDGEGNDLPMGMNLSSGVFTDELPTVKTETMTSLEKMPDALIVSDGETEITVK